MSPWRIIGAVVVTISVALTVVLLANIVMLPVPQWLVAIVALIVGFVIWSWLYQPRLYTPDPVEPLAIRAGVPFADPVSTPTAAVPTAAAAPASRPQPPAAPVAAPARATEAAFAGSTVVAAVGASGAGATPETVVVATTAASVVSRPSRPAGRPNAAPQPLFEKPVGPADDLKLITGIGPVLERNLNAVGITTYRQVAGLTAEQIAAVEAAVGFPGRVLRDNWLQQAEVLARGGVAEYQRVFGRKPK
jgi:predicted flap endonuclease-1-like 5' DNA nuclease